MIRSLLIKMRRQPKPVRDKIALSIAGGFTAIIFTVWIFNQPTKTDYTKDGEEGLISQFFENVHEQVAAVKESLPDASAEEDTVGGEAATVETDLPQASANAATYATTTAPAASEGQVYHYSTTTNSFSTTSSPTPASTGREVRIFTTSETASSTTESNE